MDRSIIASVMEISTIMAHSRGGLTRIFWIRGTLRVRQVFQSSSAAANYDRRLKRGLIVLFTYTISQVQVTVHGLDFMFANIAVICALPTPNRDTKPA